MMVVCSYFIRWVVSFVAVGILSKSCLRPDHCLNTFVNVIVAAFITIFAHMSISSTVVSASISIFVSCSLLHYPFGPYTPSLWPLVLISLVFNFHSWVNLWTYRHFMIFPLKYVSFSRILLSIPLFKLQGWFSWRLRILLYFEEVHSNFSEHRLGSWDCQTIFACFMP